MTKLWLIGGGVFLGILLVGSVILALTQKEDLLPLGTPEAAIQDFLKAAEADDFQVSYDFLSEDLKAECQLEDFVRQRPFEVSRIEDSRISLEKTTSVGEITFVDVRVSQFYGSGPFGSSESTYTQQYSLRQEDGLWKFSVYPWPYNNCGIPKPVPPVREPVRQPSPAPTPVVLQAPTAEPPAKPAAP